MAVVHCPKTGIPICRTNENGMRPPGLKYSLGNQEEPLIDLQFLRKGPSLEVMKLTSKDSRRDSQQFLHVVKLYCNMFRLKYK
jgi:hypothetical protein